MFESLQDRLQGVFDQLNKRGRLSEADVDKALREVRLALLEADVNFKVVKAFIEGVKQNFGKDFWGFWMLGGMSGGVAPPKS